MSDTTTPDLTETEMLEILKDIARSASNQAARIAAIKELRAMKRGEQSVEDTVRGLYEVGNPGRIRKAA
jgi:hypothetical protein